MCRAIEEMLKQSLFEVARRLLFDGRLSLEKIASVTGLTLDEIAKLKTATPS